MLLVGLCGEAVVDSTGERMQVASVLRRHEQVPLSPEKALEMADLARRVGDREAEVELLRGAVREGPFAEIARVELALAVVETSPDEAIALVLPTLIDEGTPQLFAAARSVVYEASGRGLESETVASVLQAVSGLSRRSRRTISAALADPQDVLQRPRIIEVLNRYPGDLVALDVARRLDGVDGLDDRARFLIARCLYRHALYSEASERLRSLTESKAKNVPRWEVRFLIGRCAFRIDRFADAADWYAKALAVAPGRREKAEMLVHRARALELDGDAEAAAELARQAVLTDTSDDRRLYLARLRLKTGRLDLAELGVSRIRRASDRDRGRVLIGLHHLAKNAPDAAVQTLLEVRRRPWRSSARVLAAKVLVESEKEAEALQLLRKAAPELNQFWAARARELMRAINPATRSKWREQRLVEAASGDSSKSLRALRELAILEPAEEPMARVRELAAERRAVDPSGAEDKVRGLAAELLAEGLQGLAVRWDPGGFPRNTPSEALWTAESFTAGGAPWRSIRVADGAWRMLGADLPMRAYPERLVATAYPASFFDDAQRASQTAGVDWTVVSGVAREESRWDADVLSRVGARGLMQLMPRTAEQVAERLKLESPLPEELFDPEVSLQLGASELARLVEAFDGFAAPAVAAYNAGEAQSRLWLEQCGPGCDVERFLLTISFGATRHYTEDVLASAQIHGRLVRGENAKPRGAPSPAAATGQSPD